MKRYDTYKDSGVQWLGKIPSHWDVKRLASAFVENRNLNVELKSIEAYKFNYGTLVRKDEDVTNEDVIETYRKYTLIEPKDILINGLNLNYDFVSQRVAISENRGIITSAYLAITPRENINPYYYCYFLKAMDSKKLFHGMGTGIRLTLSFAELKKQFILFPSVKEQEGIVAFLDEKTAEIDELVRQVEREIELLKEYKQAEIARVVTRGLNPNAPLKPSGISWIGDIPQHWKLRRAKYVFQKHKRPVRPEDEVITCFRDGEVTLRKNRRTTGFTESLTETGYQGVRKGDLVIHQMDAFAGAIGISDSDGKGTPVYHCCTPITNECTRYFCYQIRMMAFSGFIQSLYRGIRERSSDFNFQVFGNQYLFIPPLAEQQEIVDYIDRKTTEVDRLVVELTYQVEYLKEYKQRLIADVVTGKINVQRN